LVLTVESFSLILMPYVMPVHCRYADQLMCGFVPIICF